LASTSCAGAITVSQWQMFASWRTLPGKSNWVSRASAASVMRLPSTPSSRALFCRKKRRRRDVFLALAQRRQAQANDVEAMEQVLAERAALTRSSRSWWWRR
jgi:hypothetical protein